MARLARPAQHRRQHRARSQRRDLITPSVPFDQGLPVKNRVQPGRLEADGNEDQQRQRVNQQLEPAQGIGQQKYIARRPRMARTFDMRDERLSA